MCEGVPSSLLACVGEEAVMYGSDPLDERTGNYVLDHWRGYLSLPISYWVNGTIISGASAMLIIGISADVAQSDASLQASSAIGIALQLIGLAVWVWGIVGIWRSSAKHPARGGSPAWATVAKAMVILGSLNVAGQLAKASQQLIESSQIAAGQDPIGAPATFAIDGQSLRLDGWIVVGTANHFEEILDQNPQVRRIYLTSGGGRIREARQMASAIRARKLSTTASGDCSSACTILFLAGRERSAAMGSSLGFHSPSGVGLSDEEARSSSPDMRASYEAAGLPYDFVERAMSTPSSSMWRPTEKQLVSAGVINAATKERIIEDNVASARSLNAQAPTKLDEVTSLIRAQANGMMLTYFYRIEADTAEVIDRGVMTILRKQNQINVCKDVGLNLLVRSGAIYRFDYADRRGRHIAALDVSDCEAPQPNTVNMSLD